MAARKAFLLRLDPAVLTALEAWAADAVVLPQDRSAQVTAAIEFLLREALRKAGRKVKPPADADAPAEPSGDVGKRRRAADE